MEREILKAATEITVAAVQSIPGIIEPGGKPLQEWASALFKAVYKAVEEATSASISQQGGGIVF